MVVICSTRKLQIMLEENKDLIIKNFLILMKECNVDGLIQLLVEKGIFSKSEITQIFSSDDARHNKRLFFFAIQKKEQNAFNMLIESLKKTNQHNIVKLLVPEVKGCRTFTLPPETTANDSYLIENVPLHVSSDTSLTVRVVPATEFRDTIEHNRKVKFYSSRSKKRGRVLIINNFDYSDKVRHPYRNGAQVDTNNLHELFNQMGGWEINHVDNLTVEQMVHRLIQFSQDNENKQYDICFVIVMGHGQEESNRTIIYGIDGKSISTDDIYKHFTNKKCISFKGKPKIFLFQVCRGSALDYTIRLTETDSALRSGPSDSYQTTIDYHYIRTKEDILIGFATLHGFKAHRDKMRGSWYIELICKHFMNDACTYAVDSLLKMVDDDLRGRMSEMGTMQTSEYNNKGFKNLYLNPGIYYEDGILKHFHS